ncbi:MAG: hypothetical protein V1846_01185 [Candidatus Komeilibacteria bacterium]
MPEELMVVVARREWQRLLDGQTNTVTVLKETDLHRFFGDHPEEYIVRLKVTALPEGQS